MPSLLHALPLAAALLLAGCTAAGSAAHHGADHPAAAQAGAAPHHAHGDALPEAATVHAPSGTSAAHTGPGQQEHGAHAHAAHGTDGEGCSMGCCDDGACTMPCCQTPGDAAHDHAERSHMTHTHTTREHAEGAACQMPCCQDGGSCAHGDHVAHIDLTQTAAPARHTHADPVALPADGTRALRQALEAYLVIGDRLADDSVSGVAEEARTLEAAAAQLAAAPALVEHADHLASIRQHADHLAHARDLPDARDAFGEMGPALAHLVAAVGAPEGLEVTRFVCGMADAPEGGVWLQRSGEDPRNPYFGAAMLRCHRGQEAL